MPAELVPATDEPPSQPKARSARAARRAQATLPLAEPAAHPPIAAPVVPPKIKLVSSDGQKPKSRAFRMVIATGRRHFRKKFFPEASDAEWNDWGWQSRHRIRTFDDAQRMLRLSEEEVAAFQHHRGSLPMGITPYYMSLLDPENALSPLRRTVVPVGAEYLRSPGEEHDPLGEDGDSPVPGLVHRYPDRVLFLVTKFCSTYCRYCTRSRLVGESEGEYRFSTSQWNAALEYIARTPTIRDVLISGGDPLTMADDKIEYLISNLRRIKHVEFIRIGTKVPSVLPQRITPALTRMLKKYHPLWMSIHFLHPDELTPEVAEATGRLADAGIPLGSQTVLLKGVNDNVETMKTLVHGLLRNRVRPYYLYQCDPIEGSAHFRTTVDKGVEIIRGLRGHTTGYAVPTFVVDAPGGGGKIPLIPNYVAGRDDGSLVLSNFEGKHYKYHDPEGKLGSFISAQQPELPLPL